MKDSSYLPSLWSKPLVSRETPEANETLAKPLEGIRKHFEKQAGNVFFVKERKLTKAFCFLFFGCFVLCCVLLSLFLFPLFCLFWCFSNVVLVSRFAFQNISRFPIVVIVTCCKKGQQLLSNYCTTRVLIEANYVKCFVWWSSFASNFPKADHSMKFQGNILLRA